eukprot:5985504-Prymnesium_polylepis.2
MAARAATGLRHRELRAAAREATIQGGPASRGAFVTAADKLATRHTTLPHIRALSDTRGRGRAKSHPFIL